MASPLPGSRSGAVNKPKEIPDSHTSHQRAFESAVGNTATERARLRSARGVAVLVSTSSHGYELLDTVDAVGREVAFGLGGFSTAHRGSTNTLRTTGTRKQPSYAYIVLLGFEVGSHRRQSTRAMVYAPFSCRARSLAGVQGSPVGVCLCRLIGLILPPCASGDPHFNL